MWGVSLVAISVFWGWFEYRAYKEMAWSSRLQAILWCRWPGSNRYGIFIPRDFKSRASANSATSAFTTEILYHEFTAVSIVFLSFFMVFEWVNFLWIFASLVKGRGTAAGGGGIHAIVFVLSHNLRHRNVPHWIPSPLRDPLPSNTFALAKAAKPVSQSEIVEQGAHWQTLIF